MLSFASLAIYFPRTPPRFFLYVFFGGDILFIAGVVLVALSPRGSGAGAEGQEDSDRSRGGQDNRERLPEDEIRDLRRDLERLKNRLWWVGFFGLLALLLILLVLSFALPKPWGVAP